MTIGNCGCKLCGLPGTSLDDLRILLCVHDWVQDEGTESV
jgi:hypothetical protein